jgi:hypothetical protein
MAPARRKRNPRTDEIDLVALNRLLEELPQARRARIDYDVVQILNVAARTKCLRALMLVFLADDDSAARASFVIDGHHSPDHDRAFEDVDGLRRLGIQPADTAAVDNERPLLPDELEALRPDPATVDRLDERRRATKAALEVASADAAVDELEVVTSPPAADGRPEGIDQPLDALRHDLQAVEAEQAAMPLRPISTFEHRVLLEEALDGARHRLLLIAPWVRSSVVDQRFLDSLKHLCTSGVAVHIGYGIRKNDADGHDRKAVAALEQLARRFSNLVLRDLGDTHAKILIWDDRMVVTSFNWLSFRGDRRRAYRQEAGVLIGEQSYVDQEYARHRALIEA